MKNKLEYLIPKSIFDDGFCEDNVGFLTEFSDITHLLTLDRGTVLIPNHSLKFIPVLRKTRIDLIGVEDPELSWNDLHNAYLKSLPTVNEKRLKFIQEQRSSHIYQDLGIHDTAIIGEAGMGYEWNEDHWLEFPQNGSVKIGADVRIGAYSVIKKGTIQDTVIGDGCKIGSHCNIGHNVTVGKNCLLTHRVSIAGSCEIGERVFFGQGSIIKNKIKIGSGAYIGQGANVISDVPAGATVAGNPAKIIKQ